MMPALPGAKLRVDAGGAPEEAGRAEDSREPHVEAAFERQQADSGKTEAGKAHLQLERTVGPPDEGCGRFPEEYVQDEVIEIRDRDRKQQEIGEERLDGHCRVAWLMRVPQ